MQEAYDCILTPLVVYYLKTEHTPYRKDTVPVVIWYRTKVRWRHGSGSGIAMPYYIALNETASPLDIRQGNTLGTHDKKYELPELLVDLVTELQGYWHDEDEHDFWERWLVYREMPSNFEATASTSIQRMVRQWMTVTTAAPEIRSGTTVKLWLRPKNETSEATLLMELEVTLIESIVFERTPLQV